MRNCSRFTNIVETFDSEDRTTRGSNNIEGEFIAIWIMRNQAFPVIWSPATDLDCFKENLDGVYLIL